MALDFGGFLHISAFSLQYGEVGGGGTDINWNHPRRCVWVDIQYPEKFYNSLFSNCMGEKFIVLTYRKQFSNRNSIGERTFRIYCFHILEEVLQ